MIFNDDVIIDVQNTVGSAAGAFRIGGPITGLGGLIKNGPGVLTVAFTPSQVNLFKDYTGPTVINGGRFRISSGGTPRLTSSVTVNAGGQIVYASAGATFTFGNQLATIPDLNLNGTGLAAFPGAIRADQGVSTAGNHIVLQSNASINVPGTANSLSLPNGISGPGRFEVGTQPGDPTNQGVVNFTGANTYTGGTLITQGTLVVQGGSSLSTGNVWIDGTSAVGSSRANGKLTLQTLGAISDTAYLNITGDEGLDGAVGGYVNLDGGGNEVIGGLMLGGVIFGAGTYGSLASGAANPGLANPDAYFHGAGTVTVVPAGVPGDYNNNGTVDAADEVLWRKGGLLANDFTPGNQASDYDFWRARFAATTNPGSGSGLGAGAVPEPSTVALLGCAASILAVRRRRKLVVVPRSMNNFSILPV